MIDIVLASKNQINFVNDTLNALKNQTFQNFNLICIDGYSSDGTDLLLKEFKNSRLTYSKSNVEIAYIEGILKATSEYVAFSTTSDYYIDENWLKNANSILDADKNVEIVWAGGIDITESGKYIGQNLITAKKTFPNGYRGKMANYILSDFYIPELSYVIRREFLLNVIKENNLLAVIPLGNNRYELWYYIIISLLKKESIVYFLPNEVFAGRKHQNSNTVKVSQKQKIFMANAKFDALKIIFKNFFNYQKPSNLLNINLIFLLRLQIFIIKYLRSLIRIKLSI